MESLLLVPQRSLEKISPRHHDRFIHIGAYHIPQVNEHSDKQELALIDDAIRCSVPRELHRVLQNFDFLSEHYFDRDVVEQYCPNKDLARLVFKRKHFKYTLHRRSPLVRNMEKIRKNLHTNPYMEILYRGLSSIVPYVSSLKEIDPSFHHWYHRTDETRPFRLIMTPFTTRLIRRNRDLLSMLSTVRAVGSPSRKRRSSMTPMRTPISTSSLR
jgi:hypothetical protein